MRRKEAALLMKRDESGEIRLSREELENGSFDDVAAVLAEETITRGRAIKLAGAALLGGACTLLWPGEADARKKKRRRRRRRRKARVETPAPLPRHDAEAGTPIPITLNVTNPAGPGGPDLTISEVRLVDANGTVLAPALPVTIEPGETAQIPVTVTYEPTSPLIDAGELRLFEGGVAVGDVSLSLTP
jgi:hypothetical protein